MLRLDELDGVIESFELAFRMQGKVPEVMDIKGESQSTLDSYGIGGMRERAASIGATLDIAGTSGVGTTVRCEVRPI